jgi:hypothetical protein
MLVPVLSMAHNELDDSLIKYYKSNSVTGNSKKVDDYKWIRRVSIDLAGRIPTHQEVENFVKSTSPDKKLETVSKILNSVDYVNNYQNFWADLLRIRPERLSDDVALLKSYPYMQYVKTFIRDDISYKSFVFELLSATGRYTDNPATGYMIRDNGMPLDNLATSLQLFIGKDIACAQCHDDPFQDYSQKQFYEMAALFNPLDNREKRSDYSEVLKKIDSEIKEITQKDRIDNNVRQLLAANLFNLSDNDGKVLKYPHDYKYSDAEPFQEVSASTLDGKLKGTESNKRQLASEWIVNHEDFQNAIVNRIWANIVGKPLIGPETNFNVGDYPEGQVLKHLGEYFKTHDFSIKELIKLITTSDFYSRVAYVGNVEDYKLQSVLVKRMSAYQIWDSILTLVLPDVNYTRVSFSEYSDLLEIDWKEVNGQKALDAVSNLKEYDNKLSQNFLKYKNIDLVRAAYSLKTNSFLGQFLKEYGCSDRVLLDSSDSNGSITQILTIMNSPVMELLLDKKSQIFQSFSKNSQKDSIFLSILGRPANVEERALILKTDLADLVWALINSREFLFRI